MRFFLVISLFDKILFHYGGNVPSPAVLWHDPMTMLQQIYSVEKKLKRINYTAI